jgi:hypothetical protein
MVGSPKAVILGVVAGLSVEPGVGEAKVDLGGAVAAELVAERAANGDVVRREGLYACRNVPAAALALDHIDGRNPASLLAVMHAHEPNLIAKKKRIQRR